jgi:hypothetical protein
MNNRDLANELVKIAEDLAKTHQSFETVEVPCGWQDCKNKVLVKRKVNRKPNARNPEVFCSKECDDKRYDWEWNWSHSS